MEGLGHRRESLKRTLALREHAAVWRACAREICRIEGFTDNGYIEIVRVFEMARCKDASPVKVLVDFFGLTRDG
jgi:hypothetical protein